MTKPHVLFVDDEQPILQGLRRTLRSMRNEWEMSFAGSGVEALKLMAEGFYDAVVTDMRMPGMDGAQLLNEVKERYPKTLRFILSGHADRLVIMRSLGATHQYLAKPCDAETLKSKIKKALALSSLIEGDPLFDPLIARIQTLPSLPALYVKIKEVLASPDPSIGRIGEIIAQDPAMTAKILQLVNSAFFGVPQKITNPATAVNLLGIDTIQALVLSAHVFSQLDKWPPYVDLDQMWRHSAQVGDFASEIVRIEGGDNEFCSEARVAGMLHDVGKLVLVANLPSEYERLHNMAAEGNGDLIELERLQWGATHAEVGAYLLGLWGLPEGVVKAVALHHSAGEELGDAFSTIPAVYAANGLAHEFSTSDDEPLDTLESTDLESFSERLPAWREHCANRFATAIE